MTCLRRERVMTPASCHLPACVLHSVRAALRDGPACVRDPDASHPGGTSVKSFVSLVALAAISVGIALPLMADDKPGMKEGCEKVTLDKPFSEIAARVPEALRGAGL